MKQSMAILLVQRGHPEEQQWHSAIGRAVVSFGTLERQLLYWVAGVRKNPDMVKAYHKVDMKKIVELLEDSLESYQKRLPPDDYREAIRLVHEARRLVQDRNDVAHGWLSTMNDRPDGHICLMLAKKDPRPFLVFAKRDLAWIRDVADRIEAASVQLRAVLLRLEANWPSTDPEARTRR
jgi:hypothetical protein